MILNPGRPRRRRKARRAPVRRRRARAHARRHHARRASNPIRFIRRARRHVRRRRLHMNPLGIRGGGKILGLPLMNAVTITAGALVVRAIGNLGGKYIPLPDGPLKKYGTQAAAAVVGSMLVRKFVGHKWGDAVATGGTIAILLSVVQDYVVPKVPLLGDYEQTYLPGVGEYQAQPLLQGAGNSSEQWEPHF